jgi:hypothetical protein
MRNQPLVFRQKGKLLPCAAVEIFFEIINDIHVKNGHARSAKKRIIPTSHCALSLLLMPRKERKLSYIH